MRVVWASAAEQDHADIIDYISQDNPLAAIRMDELFAEAAGRLAEHPHPDWPFQATFHSLLAIPRSDLAL